MAQYQGPRAPNVSQFIANLNAIPSNSDMSSPPQQQQPGQEFAGFDDDVALFTNTDFFDFDLTAANDKTAFMNHGPSPAYFPQVAYSDGHISAPNSLPPSPPNGVPLAGQLQQSQPTIPTAHHFAGLMSMHQQQIAGQKRKADDEIEMEEQFRAAAEEDKRRRNTAASARFRVKKKQREQALEKTAKEMSERVQVLEARIGQLEMENQWLKGLITEKNVKVGEAPSAVKPEEEKGDVQVTNADNKDAAKTFEDEEVIEAPTVKTSLVDKKRGVGTAV